MNTRKSPEYSLIVVAACQTDPHTTEDFKKDLFKGSRLGFGAFLHLDDDSYLN